MIPFHIRLVRLKLTYYSLISRYYFETAHVPSLTVLVLYNLIAIVGILLRKIKPCDHNKIKPPSEKYSKNINQLDINF